MFLGLAFIVLSWKFSVVSGQTILLFGILWVTTIIAVMDWETKLVSEAIVITWAVLVLMSVGLSLSPLVGVVTGVGIIGGIWAATKGKAMGFGDVEIAAVMGYWLGWQNTLVGLWLAFVTGAIVGVYQIIKGKKKYFEATNPQRLLEIEKGREDKIKKVLETIRPSLQMDGGDVHFVGFDANSGVLSVELMGHCAHCPMSTITLKQGIEAEIKKAVKAVKEVRAIQM